MPDVKWSRAIVVKGTVKLQDFEKYIQELPLSRNKELMVVSLYCKQESSQVGLEGMQKVAKKYVADGRVGLAKVITGIDLYLCPPSDTIITILEKYGYLDGSTHFKENKGALIGCVIWRRNQINHLNSVQKSSRKNDHVQVRSPIRTPSEWSRKKDPTIWSPIRTPSKWSRKNDHVVCSPIRTSSESSRKNDPTVWSPIHTSPESSRKNDPPVCSPIRTSSESSRKNDPAVCSPIRISSESSRKNDPAVCSPIRTSSESSRKNDPAVCSPIRTSSESSRKNDPTVWSLIRTSPESSRKNNPVVCPPISTSSESSRKNDPAVWSPILTSPESSRKNDPAVCSPIRTSSESSRKNDHTVWSPIHTSPKSSRKNDLTLWSPIRTSSEPSRKNHPVVWSPIRTPSETSRKIDSSPVWSPIRWPLESPTESDQVQQRDNIETDKNGSIAPQPHLNFRAYYYSDLVKSEDTTDIDLNSKDVGRELVHVVTAVTKQSFPSTILHNEPEDDLPEYEFGISQKRRLDDVTEQSLSAVVLQKELKDDLPEFDFGTFTASYQTLQKERLDAVTKQTLSSAILRKELEDDLPEYEFGTLNTSCQTSENTRWEENMEQDMDISPQQSPQKKVCKIDENSNMSSSTTLFAAAAPMSPVNPSWYPSVQYMNQLNAKVTKEASNIPHFTYLGSVSNSMQQNFIPSPSAFQIHPPFQTLKSDFTYLGPTFTRSFTEADPQPHAHSHVRVGRDHMTEFNQHFTFNPQKTAHKQYQSPGQ